VTKRTKIIMGLLALDALSLGLALSVQLGDPLNLTQLPVGDGKYSTTTPQRGQVYVCADPRMAGGGGAQRAGPWLRADGTFDLTAKAVVDGSVNWAHRLNTTLEGMTLRVEGNGLPSHPTGVYPIASSDDAYQYDRNPNRIRERPVAWNLPANPQLAPQPSCTRGVVGVMLTGSLLYNGLDALGRDAVAHETQDACQGHPDPTGTYHYHNLSSCARDTTSGQSKLLGYALDGFGIYGPRDENGRVLTNADLDECHGRTAEIEWRAKRVVMYHYVASNEYPYTVGCFRGTPIRPPR
jgi:hypothetical protein